MMADKDPTKYPDGTPRPMSNAPGGDPVVAERCARDLERMHTPRQTPKKGQRLGSL